MSVTAETVNPEDSIVAESDAAFASEFFLAPNLPMPALIEASPAPPKRKTKAEKARAALAEAALLPVIDGADAVALKSAAEATFMGEVRSFMATVKGFISATKDSQREHELRINAMLGDFEQFRRISDPTEFGKQVFAGFLGAAQRAAQGGQLPVPSAGSAGVESPQGAIPPQMQMAIAQVEANAGQLAASGVEPSNRQLLFAAMPLLNNLPVLIAQARAGGGAFSPNSPSNGGGAWIPR